MPQSPTYAPSAPSTLTSRAQQLTHHINIAYKFDDPHRHASLQVLSSLFPSAKTSTFQHRSSCCLPIDEDYRGRETYPVGIKSQNNITILVPPYDLSQREAYHPQRKPRFVLGPNPELQASPPSRPRNTKPESIRSNQRIQSPFKRCPTNQASTFFAYAPRITLGQFSWI